MFIDIHQAKEKGYFIISFKFSKYSVHESEGATSIIEADSPAGSSESESEVGLVLMLIHSFVQQKITKQLLYLRNCVRYCKHKDEPSKHSFSP